MHHDVKKMNDIMQRVKSNECIVMCNVCIIMCNVKSRANTHSISVKIHHIVTLQCID